MLKKIYLFDIKSEEDKIKAIRSLAHVGQMVNENLFIVDDSEKERIIDVVALGGRITNVGDFGY